MKTCNNCGTANEINAIKCVSCNMRGNFSSQDTPAAAPIAASPTIQCRNCGSHQVLGLPKCTQCHFPLPALKADNTIKLDSSHRFISIPKSTGHV